MKMSFAGCDAVSRSGRLVIERLLVQVPVQTDHMTGVFGQDTNTRAAVQITIYNKVIQRNYNLYRLQTEIFTHFQRNSLRMGEAARVY